MSTSSSPTGAPSSPAALEPIQSQEDIFGTSSEAPQLPPPSWGLEEKAKAEGRSTELALRRKLSNIPQSEGKFSSVPLKDIISELYKKIKTDYPNYLITLPGLSVVRNGKFILSPLVAIFSKETHDILPSGIISSQQKAALKGICGCINEAYKEFSRTDTIIYLDFLQGKTPPHKAQEKLDAAAEAATSTLVMAFNDLEKTPSGKESYACLKLLAKTMAHIIDRKAQRIDQFFPREQTLHHKYYEQLKEFETARKNGTEKAILVQQAIGLKKLLKDLPESLRLDWNRLLASLDIFYCLKTSLYKDNSEFFNPNLPHSQKNRFQKVAERKALSNSALALIGILSICQQVTWRFSFEKDERPISTRICSLEDLMKSKNAAMQSYLHKPEDMPWNERILEEMWCISQFGILSANVAHYILNPDGKTLPEKEKTREVALKLSENLHTAGQAFQDLAEFFMEEVYRILPDEDSSEIEAEAQKIYEELETRAVFFREFSVLITNYGEKYAKPAPVASSSRLSDAKETPQEEEIEETIDDVQSREEEEEQEETRGEIKEKKITISQSDSFTTLEADTEKTSAQEPKISKSHQTGSEIEASTNAILQTLLPIYKEAESLKEKGKRAKHNGWNAPTYLSGISNFERCKEECRQSKIKYRKVIAIFKKHHREDIGGILLRDVEIHYRDMANHELAYRIYLNNSHSMYPDELMLFLLKEFIFAKPAIRKNGTGPYIELLHPGTGKVEDRFVEIQLDRDNFETSNVSITQNQLFLHGHLHDSYHFINLHILLKDIRENKKEVIICWTIKTSPFRVYPLLPFLLKQRFAKASLLIHEVVWNRKVFSEAVF